MFTDRSPFSQNTEEFSLIHRYFNAPAQARQNKFNQTVSLGIGDDCALLTIPEAHHIAISTDTLVENRHFIAGTDAADIAYKAFMVSVSDLAAMGAEPKWLSLALTLPSLSEPWLERFSQQLFALLDAFCMQLIGGDTTKGPLSISLTVQGIVPVGRAIKRSTAQAGDDIYVTRTLGNSALGLLLYTQAKQFSESLESVDLQVKAEKIKAAFNPAYSIMPLPSTNELNAFFSPKISPINAPSPQDLSWAIAWLKGAYLYPKAQIEFGLALRGIASSAIDISDGLASDLNHICAASGLAAEVDLAAIPVSHAFEVLWKQHSLNTTFLLNKQLALTGGDDYELCFTLNPSMADKVHALAMQLNLPITRIGRMVESADCTIRYYNQNQPIPLKLKGFDHFCTEQPI